MKNPELKFLSRPDAPLPKREDPQNSRFLSPSANVPPKPGTYKHHITWRWLQYQELRPDDRAAKAVAILRKRVDMPNQFPTKKYFFAYMTKAGVDDKTIEICGLRLWTLYKVYRDFVLHDIRPYDGNPHVCLPVDDKYKTSQVWRWLQDEKADSGDGEVGQTISNLRKRTDMPGQFPNMKFVLSYLLSSGIDPVTAERVYARLWHLYVQYNDVSSNSLVLSPDGQVVNIAKKVYKSNPLLKRD